MYRVALFIGLNNKKEILLQYKTADAPKNANLWVLFGGSIEEQETPQETIRREMNEELKIEIAPHFFKTYIQEESWGAVERSVFYGDVSESVRTLQSNLQEGGDVRFFPIEQLQTVPINRNHLAIIMEFVRAFID